jgi:hypothetical protein
LGIPNSSYNLTDSDQTPTSPFDAVMTSTSTCILSFDTYEEFDVDSIYIYCGQGFKKAKELFKTWTWDADTETLTGSDGTIENSWYGPWGTYYIDTTINTENDVEPQLVEFPLSDIDNKRLSILKDDGNAPYYIDAAADIDNVYGKPLFRWYASEEDKWYFSCKANQEGLLIKTYQSDLFNNWMSTEWIDGENGINEITRISTESGYITIDEINLSKKIYMMLNRIAISGGTYDDWLDATYTHERVKSTENPIYHGGLSRELVFQEVISTAAVENSQPLGTLGGRGVLTSKRKGGKATIRISEPSYIMGIVSLTPRIDYSQGNKWDTNLKNMDDFHKPQLSAIGFQDLITDQMAFWETDCANYGTEDPKFKSAGKQPAWINYMTNVNQVRGNFALQNEQMYMTLNRRYEVDNLGKKTFGIKDLTTYVDPSKFNHIFADTRRDAQNFWTQIAVDIKARRKMSAKVMPNI